MPFGLTDEFPTKRQHFGTWLHAESFYLAGMDRLAHRDVGLGHPGVQAPNELTPRMQLTTQQQLRVDVEERADVLG
jgi:hypothetical protein